MHMQQQAFRQMMTISRQDTSYKLNVHFKTDSAALSVGLPREPKRKLTQKNSVQYSVTV